MKASLFGTWHSIAQRPHHLAGTLMRTGFKVDIFTARGVRCTAPNLDFDPSLHTRLMLPSRLYQLPLAGNFFKRMNDSIDQAVFSEFIASKADIFIHYRPPQHYSSVGIELSGPLVYDCIDDWEGFTGADPRIVRWEHTLCERADQIWVVSRHLEEKHASWSDKVRYVPNGVDYPHFANSRIIREAQDKLKTYRPRLIYIGALFDWFNAHLVGEVADQLRDWQIDLIGPYRLSAVQRKALNRPNIRLLGGKDYLELPALLADADVAMIPFVINDLIRGTNPIKLYEYLAAGVPVVATPMPEVLPYVETDVVACAEGPTEFARAVKDLAATANADRCQEIARESSWDARFMGAIKTSLLLI